MISCPMRERVLGRLAAEKAASQGDRPFIYFGDLTISYRELDTLSNRLANGLAALGVKKGTHVALLIENKPEIVLMYFALGKLGAVSVPVNTAVKGELLAYYLVQSDSELVIADEDLVERLVAVEAQIPKLRRLVSIEKETPDSSGAQNRGERSSYRNLLEAPDHPRDEGVRFNDLHSLIYTSGT